MFHMNAMMNYMVPLENPYTPSIKNIDSYNMIAANLYLGNIDALKDQDKFDLIVNCTKHIPLATKCEQTVRIPVDDHPSESENMMKNIKETNVLEKIHIHRINNKPVLVHCHAGMQRSATIVACYLIHYYKMTPEEAIRFIRSKRPVAFFPKPNFLQVIQNPIYQK